MAREPRIVKVHSLKNQALIADKCYVAECFFDRLRGLIGRSDFAAGRGMLFPKCNSIHMWFMKLPIDVVFLSEGVKENSFMVTSVRENIQPWRACPLGDFKASHTLELPVGSIKRCSIIAGDELCIS